MAQSVQWDPSVPKVKLEDPDPKEPSGRSGQRVLPVLPVLLEK